MIGLDFSVLWQKKKEFHRTEPVQFEPVFGPV